MMFDLKPLYLILGIHFGLIVLYLLVYLISGKSIFRREHMLPIFIIPIFGLLIGLAIQLVHAAGRANQKSVDMEPMHLGSDIYWRPLRKPQENIDLVPLEEAISLDSYGVRRRILLDALFDEPSKHLSVLLVARHNEDAETAHYAATTIEKIQRDFQMEIQRYTAFLKAHPDDAQIIDANIRLLERYIDSGLLETHMADRQREIMSELLDRKLAISPNDKITLIKKLRNSLALRKFTTCLEISKQLRLWWPKDEDSWIESLRVCVEAKDPDLFKEVEKGIKNIEIEWSKSGRDQLKNWIEGVPAL